MNRLACLLVVSLACLEGPVALAQSAKLNGPLARATDSVRGFVISAAGDRVLFWVRPHGGAWGPHPIYSCSTDGTTPQAFLGDTRFPHEPALSPDGLRVVFLSDADQGVYSVPTDASQPPVRLSGAGTSVGDYAVSPDGQRVVYRASELTAGVPELFSAPTDGSAPGVRISAPLEAGWIIYHIFTVTPDNARVVYLTVQGSSQSRIYSAPIDGSGPVILLDTVPVYASAIWREATADGSRLVYLTDALVNDRFDLYSVPLDGSTPRVLLHAAPPSDRDVIGFRLSPDGTRAVYLADHEDADVDDLYSVPTDGSAAPVRLNESAPHADVLTDFEISPDGIGVAFRSDKDRDELPDLYAIGIEGIGTAVKRSGAMTPGGFVRSFHYSPDNTRLVFVADRRIQGITELYSAPVAAGAPVKLHGDLTAQQDVHDSFAISPDATRVVFKADLGTDGAFALHVAPIDGSGPTVELNTLATSGSSIATFVVSADGSRVVYGESRSTGATVVNVLHSVPLDGSEAPVVLSPDLPEGPVIGGVFSYRISPDGRRAAYLASQHPSFVRELYTVLLDGPPAPVRLNGYTSSSIGGFAFDDDGSHIVFSAGEMLQSVPSDGGAPPIVLAESTSFVIDPAGTRVAYLELGDLMIVPIDGSAPPKRLSDPIEGLTIVEFRFTPDGERLVYRLEGVYPNVDSPVYSVPSDRGPLFGDTPRLLHPFGGPFEISPNGQRVVFEGTATFNGALFSSPIMGGGATNIVGTIVSGTTIESFDISPDGTRVVFLADKQVNDRFELYSAPILGGAEPIEIGSITHPSADVGLTFLFTPDGTRVLFLSTQVSLTSYDLYVVPFDGSGPALALDAHRVQPVTGMTPSVTPDSTRALFYSDILEVDRNELFSVLLDGSAPSVRVSGELVAGGDVGSSALTTRRGTEVLYAADQLTDERDELFVAPVDGSAAAARISAPLVPGGNIVSFRATADSLHVVYRADQEIDEVFELYRVTRPAPTNDGKPVKHLGGPPGKP